MATPNWSAASAGGTANAGQINQFLGTHNITFVYQGSSISSSLTAAGGGIGTNGQTIAQSFSSGSNTSMSRVEINVANVGTGSDTTVAISTAATGGTILVSTVLPVDFLTNAGVTISVPLPCTLTASTTYYIQLQSSGTSSNHCLWNKSTSASGAYVSGSSQSYGFIYNVFSGYTGSLSGTWEDSGARWVSTAYTSSQITSLYEYTGSMRSVRTLAYDGTSGDLKTVT